MVLEAASSRRRQIQFSFKISRPWYLLQRTASTYSILIQLISGVVGYCSLTLEAEQTNFESAWEQ